MDESVNVWLILLICNLIIYLFRSPLFKLVGIQQKSNRKPMVKKAIIMAGLHREEENIQSVPSFKVSENDTTVMLLINGFPEKVEKDYEKAIPVFENVLDLDVAEWNFERGRCTIIFSKEELPVEEYYCSENPTESLVIGIDPQRGEVHWDFNVYPHMLVIGGTGTGKSVAFKNIITQFEDDWEIFFCDPKQVEFGELVFQGYRVAFDEANIKDSIERCVELMESRYTLMRESRVVKYSQLPDGVRPKPAFLIIDEFASFFALLDNKEANKYSSLLRMIVQKGRAAGVQVVLMTQKPSSKVLDTDTRDTISCIVAMGANRTDSYVMGFGEDGRDLKPLRIGEGYYRIGNDIRKMKTYNLSDSEFIEKISK